MTTQPKVTFGTESKAEIDRAAQSVATGNDALSDKPEHVLIHAARYEGNGWKPERRTAIVNELKRRFGISR